MDNDDYRRKMVREAQKQTEATQMAAFESRLAREDAASRRPVSAAEIAAENAVGGAIWKLIGLGFAVMIAYTVFEQPVMAINSARRHLGPHNPISVLFWLLEWPLAAVCFGSLLFVFKRTRRPTLRVLRKITRRPAKTQLINPFGDSNRRRFGK